jgi:hypothetical protein
MKRLAALLLVPSACGSPPAPAVAEERIECAVDGAAAFERVCTLERIAGPEIRLTIRHPGGGFRRLIATRDGRGVVAADGAEPASVTIAGEDLIEVAVGTDRYLLPARVR